MVYDFVHPEVNGQLLFVQGLSGGKFSLVVILQSLDEMFPGFNGGFGGELPLVSQILCSLGHGNPVKLGLPVLQGGYDFLGQELL